MADSRWIHRAETEPVGELQRRAWSQAFQNSNIDLTAISLNVRGGVHVDYTDYMEHPIPLVSDRLLEVLTLYQPRLKRRAAVLTDRERMTQETYWAIHPPELANVLSPHTKRRMDGSLEQLVLRREMAEVPLFQLVDLRETVMIVNLALAESILRRDITGVRLVKLEQELTA
ncbi:hypothetical protein [Paenibacillus amylolyticus]|uniref:Uncharacterized protein n=1 Tax=Paenibacillus amylolyticus TaxID=1451 RepID=A0A117I264_PAEAM|nr:hypothetical protein [Paenibacillus amylolyticus]GAS83223.1 unknown protein [Paenibacillus amylolyticus]